MTDVYATSSLTHRQKNALLHIRRGKDVFVTGGAGTGKSSVIRKAEQELRQAGKNVAILAPTGIAAFHVGGMTIHSFFGFPSGPCVNLGGRRQASITERVPQALQLADTVIIDEISMVRSDLIDAIISSINKAEIVSGKHKQLVVVGDFYQLPPVLQECTGDAQALEAYYGKPMHYAYAFQGREWGPKRFYTVILDEIVRQRDLVFVEALNSLRVGDRSALEYLYAETPRECLQDAISLYAYRRDVIAANQQRLKALHGQLYSYQTDIRSVEGAPPEILNRQLVDSIPGDLSFKLGARVIFTTNVAVTGRADATSSYVNGMTGVVENVEVGRDFDVKAVTVRVEDERLIRVTPVTQSIFKYAIQDNKLVKERVATYTQLPFQLAYAMTIHRAQGKTFDALNLCPRTFAPGQFYVGASRVTSSQGLHFTGPINSANVIVADEVTEFYSSLSKGRARGRPPTNKDGSVRSCIIWVPAALEKHVRREIEENRIITLKRLPPHKPGRVHMRMPEALVDGVREQIEEWRKQSKAN